MLKRSEVLAKSSIIPVALRNKPSDVLVIMMMAQELDIPPLQALNGINVISGKPVISPQLMIALIRSKIPDSFIEIIEGKDFCECWMCRDKKDALEDKQIYKSIWTLQRAEKMGLVLKDNWKKQANTMLKWRAVGDAARVVFPDILSGLYFADEFQDGSLNIDERGELKNMPSSIVVEKNETKEMNLDDNIIKQVSILTDAFHDKQKLNDLLKEMDVSSSREIKGLSDDQKKDLLIFLENKVKGSRGESCCAE
jgi:hypothetical protein